MIFCRHIIALLPLTSSTVVCTAVAITRQCVTRTAAMNASALSDRRQVRRKIAAIKKLLNHIYAENGVKFNDSSSNLFLGIQVHSVHSLAR